MPILLTQFLHQELSINPHRSKSIANEILSLPKVVHILLTFTVVYQALFLVRFIWNTYFFLNFYFQYATTSKYFCKRVLGDRYLITVNKGHITKGDNGSTINKPQSAVMSSKSRSHFIIAGVLFHLFYLWSIFDIYFVSPLVHGMNQYQSTSAPPAKRLFLIVGDGLRADTTFDKVLHPVTGEYEFLAPFLRHLVENEATYGISHTRMPTESRPGHVAMIAGFYEDVSAVTKGWQENPVDFDSFFNQSMHTYSFGSPDILPMFKEGALTGKVDAWMYGHEFEDFTQSSIELDAFVFRRLDELFHNSTSNATLKNELMEDGNVFFLHLLGCDTAGHSYRPYSAEYYDNVKFIDREVKKLVDKVKDYFGDDDTAFIFTADHGMSAFGSHGDGHPNNTRTPLIAWGAGLNEPVKNVVPVFDNYTENWELSNIRRNDVNQADITPLMSYLIGANYPVNSVGELPLSYVSGSEEQKLKAIFNNAKSILEQYRVKEEEIIESQFMYKEYQGFVKKSHSSYLKEIESLIEQISRGEENLEGDAIKLTEELMKVSLEGLKYLTTYNWQFNRAIVTLGFISWIVYSFSIFLHLFILNREYQLKTSALNYFISSIFFTGLNYVLYYQRASFNFFIYLLFPIIFWSQIFTNKLILSDGIKEFLKDMSVTKRMVIGILTIAVYESIVYAFFERWIFTLIFNILGFYPMFCGYKKWSRNFLWIITSIAISSFTMLDAVKIESLTQINISAGLVLLTAISALMSINKILNSYTRRIIFCQLLLVALMILITNKSVISLQERTGLPKDAQIGGWVVLVVSVFLMPFLHYIKPNNNYKVRMLVIYLTLAPAFIILTISFETFFYTVFSAYLAQWIDIETTLKAGRKNSDYGQLIRVTVIGFFLLQTAFFGTGNVSSISSFSLDSVYRLMPIFDPFPMGALLVVKLIIPYVLLSTGLGILNLKLNIKDYTISTLIISTSDILSLNFFYLLKTEGSWLDIGITISNYCLAIISSLFMLIVEVVAHIILKNVTLAEYVKDEKKRN